ncbi:HlyD family secretion protein [Sphingomonas montana]|uniref:HlyD family secretion protein n=1 Tax=Sphingomonas montana TaxID=1843236 RepID=UPI00096CA32A|nr:HlyD family secretion protein [Sphingomonas montana]
MADADPETQPVAPGAAPVAGPAMVAPRGWRPPVKSLGSLLLIALLVAGGIAAILYAWRLPPFTSDIQATENAYVRGQVTVVSPQVAGYLVAVPVQDFQHVTRGQMLVRIDDRIYRQRVEQAQATVAAQQATLDNSAQQRRSREAAVESQDAAVAGARAQLVRAQADMARVEDLASDGSVSLRERDQTRAALLQAEAAVQQAEAARAIGQQDVRSVAVGRGGLAAAVEGADAALNLARIDLANTIIRAPQAGTLSEVGGRVGQYVTAGTQLMFLVPEQMWVIANFKEAQTAKMAAGQRASFAVDALGGAKLTGRVQNLSPAAGSEFSIIRTDTATGNFVKVPQRIAVRIAIDPGQALARRLRPGMSVEARVDTGR